MKRYIPFAMLLALASCSLQPIEIDQPEVLDNDAPKKVFHVITESAGSNAETKVYADQDMRVVWNAGDRISIFDQTTYNHPYLFTGADGDTAGDLEDQTTSGFHFGNSVPYVYAAYPYSSSTKMDNRGDLTMILPAEQNYKADSFGIGANTMVAVSNGNFLSFKNVGGYISLRLYGNNVAVSSISLKANNGEKIAGKVKISVPLGSDPTTVMDVTATDEVTMVCEPPVTIGATAQSYTSFWFVLPPVTMAGGFTITVTDADGGIFTKSTSREYIVKRNQLDWMSALQVVPDYIAATIHFADADFEAYCLENFDRNEDGILTHSEAKLVEEIDVCTDNISSLEGIEYFTNLKTLVCTGSGVATRSGNSEYTGQLTDLDLSGNPLLETLDCHENQLTTLDLSGNPNLDSVYCTDNPMTTLTLAPGQFITDLEIPEDTQIVHDWDDGIGPESFPDPEFRAYVFDNFDLDHSGLLSEAECDAVTSITAYTENIFSMEGIEFFQNLQTLYCLPNNHNTGSLTALDVSHNTALTKLRCDSNQLLSLDVSHNTALTYLTCHSNQLASLDVSHNTALTFLGCSNNQLTSLVFSHNTALTELYCHINQLTSLDVSHNTALERLYCPHNQLTSLDVSHDTALASLICANNQLTSLDVSHNTALTTLSCSSNQLTSLDVSHNTELYSLYCDSNQLTSLDVSHNTALTVLSCSCSTMQYLYLLSGQEQTIATLSKHKNTTIVYHLEEGEVSPAAFPDATFRAYVFDNFDTDHSGLLSEEECAMVTSISVYTENIFSLEGIEFFHNLSFLSARPSNNDNTGSLTSLDLSHNTALITLECEHNQLRSLEISHNVALVILTCFGNQLSSLDVSHNTALALLYCHSNQLTSLDVSHNTALTKLMCDSNQLTSLDVSNNTALRDLYCHSNQLTSLDVGHNTALKVLYCYLNQLTSLDVSHNTALIDLRCSNSTMQYLYLLSGQEQTIATLSKHNNTTIVYR